MSDELEELYPLIETTIDLLDYVVPTNAKVYLATYSEIYTPEHEVTRKAGDRIVWKNRSMYFEEGKDEKVKIPRKRGASIQMKGFKKPFRMAYAVLSDMKALPQATFELIVDADQTSRTVTHIPRESFEPGDTLKRLFLLTDVRYADLVYDDAAEMNATGFTWGRQIASLSQEFRRDLFERSLHLQKEMPAAVVTNGRDWIRQLARYGTYDSNGDYFNKWAAGTPGPKRKFSEKYIEHTEKNRQELVLKQGLPYVYVKANDHPAMVYLLVIDETGRAKELIPHRMQRGIEWKMPTYEQNIDREFEIYFIATREGGTKESESTRRAIYHLKDRDQASHYVVDPRKLVEAALGAEVTGKLGISEGDEWAWFTQMCAALFSEPYYKLDLNQARSVNPWVKRFGADNLAAETLKFMEKAWKEQGPDDKKPVTRAARNRVRKLMGEKNSLVIPQGFPSSKNTRFVGSDGHYAFDRDIENGFVYVLPTHEYIGALAQGKFYADLYKDVKWLVPMMEGVAYLAAAAVGGWAMGARKLVMKKATKAVVNEAVRAVRPALVAMLIDIMLELVTKPVIRLVKMLDEAVGDDPIQPFDEAEAYVEVWQEFLRGFFEGYIVLNLEGRVSKLHDIVMPDEAKAVLIVTRLYELIQKFRDFLERIEGDLTDGAIAKILFNLNKSATHLVRGMASAAALLYYLDIDTVKPLLEVLSPDEKAPDPKHWAEESQKFFESVTAKLEEAGANAGSLRDLLDIGGTKPVAIGVAVGLGYVSFLTKTLGLWKHMNKVYAGLGLLAIGAIAYKAGPGETLNVGIELAKEVGRMFPGKDKKAAKLNGQLIGKLVGTFLVDKALFGEKSTMGKRLKSRPVLKVAVTGSLGGGLVGTIFKILFSRYVDLAQRLGDKVKFVHGDLKQFIADEKAQKTALSDEKMPNMKAFRAKSDDVLSFREFVEILVHLKDLMIRDRDAFNASVTEGVTELKDDFAALNRLTMAGAHLDLNKLADKELRAMMIQMNAHAATALHELLTGIDYLFAEIGGENSIMSILGELGIDTGDLSKAQQAVHSAIEPKMNGFKEAEEKHKQEQQAKDADKKPIEAQPVRP